MAIYHCSVKVFSRNKGHSAIAAAAYRNGQKLYDRSIGMSSDYTKRSGVIHSEIVLPDGENRDIFSSQELWNGVELAEKRKDASIAREFEISLPHELDKNQRLALSKDLTESLVSKFGFASEFSIHAPDKKQNEKNHHVHILTSTRKLQDSKFTDKIKELDSIKNPVAILETRKLVADIINQHLEKAKLKLTVDHRSLLDQQKKAIQAKDYEKAIQLSREPTRHVGRTSSAMANSKHNEEVAKRNNVFKNFFAGQLLKLKSEKMPEKKHKNGNQENQKSAIENALDTIKSGFVQLLNTDFFGIEKREREREVQLKIDQQLQEKRDQKLRDEQLAFNEKALQKLRADVAAKQAPIYEPAPLDAQSPKPTLQSAKRFQM